MKRGEESYQDDKIKKKTRKKVQKMNEENEGKNAEDKLLIW